MEVFLFNVFLSFIGWVPALLVSFAILWYLNSRYKKNWKLSKYFLAATGLLLVMSAIHPTNTPKNPASSKQAVQYAPRQSEKEIIATKSIIEQAKEGGKDFEEKINWKNKLEKE